MAHSRADLETTRHGVPRGESGATGAGPECWVKRRRRGCGDEQVLLSLICSFHAVGGHFSEVDAQRADPQCGGARHRCREVLVHSPPPNVSLRALPFTAVRLLADSGELECLFQRKMNTVPI